MAKLKLPATGPWEPVHIQEARAALGLTQGELAEALELGGGIHAKDSVRNWERGKRPISGPARVAIRLMLIQAGKLQAPRLKLVKTEPVE